MSEQSGGQVNELLNDQLNGGTLPTSANMATPGEAGGAVGECSTVGQRLRTARVQAGLSIPEVAQALKFSPRQIEALEADDHAALPGNTIVRGFVRSYARLLKLDVDALLQTLALSIPSAPADVRPPDNMGVASQPGVDRQLSPTISAAIVLALAALLLALWHFFGPNTAKPATTTVGQVSQSAPVAVSAPAESVPAPASSAPAFPTPSAAAVEPAVPMPAALPPAAAGAASTPLMSAATPVSGVQLLFVFQERCWLEVTDATKRKLHSGENPAGSRLVLAGRPPFEVVVGNATKATLTYDGRIIDLAPYTRADVARLTLE